MFNMLEPFLRSVPSHFSATLRCFSVSMLPGSERKDVERGGKIILPPSALDQLSRLNVSYPMLFKLRNTRAERETHCGVLEFVADEGKCYLPYWMMRNLLLEEGGLVSLSSVQLQVASYSEFQPQSPDFLDITNPKAVLENALRNFACLTTGDVIAISYNDKVYELCVKQTKPDNAVSIIECDMNVDFVTPVGYHEPERASRSTADDDIETDSVSLPEPDLGFRAFSGAGNRLDGKIKNTEAQPLSLKSSERRRGIPNLSYCRGHLTFIRTRPPPPSPAQAEDESFTAFSGEGRELKKGRHP
uniref:ubiquitin recognition factor in ER-associated degradation protein 1 n=1 Tax=Myxine glutinosa TaxID=7769 RepID=UPI00358E14E3